MKYTETCKKTFFKFSFEKFIASETKCDKKKTVSANYRKYKFTIDVFEIIFNLVNFNQYLYLSIYNSLLVKSF